MVITPASESVTNPGWFWPLAITWSWLGFETSWGCAAAIPASRSAKIDVMSSDAVANKMMRLIVSHLLPFSRPYERPLRTFRLSVHSMDLLCKDLEPDMLTLGAPLSWEVGDCFLICSGNISRDIFPRVRD